MPPPHARRTHVWGRCIRHHVHGAPWRPAVGPLSQPPHCSLHLTTCSYNQKVATYGWLDWLSMLLPCITWLRTYKIREYLLVGILHQSNVLGLPSCQHACCGMGSAPAVALAWQCAAGMRSVSMRHTEKGCMRVNGCHARDGGAPRAHICMHGHVCNLQPASAQPAAAAPTSPMRCCFGPERCLAPGRFFALAPPVPYRRMMSWRASPWASWWCPRA